MVINTEFIVGNHYKINLKNIIMEGQDNEGFEVRSCSSGKLIFFNEHKRKFIDKPSDYFECTFAYKYSGSDTTTWATSFEGIRLGKWDYCPSMFICKEDEKNPHVEGGEIWY